MTAERTVRIVLKGDLDVYRAKEVEAKFPPPGDADRIVVDCSRANIIDSSVITVFVRYRRAFAQAGGDPINIVFIVSDPMRRIFDITGISKFMTVISASDPDAHKH